MQKAFIFDMDGTLFDTETLTREALRAVPRRHAERDDVDDFYPTVCGSTLPKAKFLYEAFYGKNYPFYERYEEMHGWIKEFVDKNGMPVKKGAQELLAYLKENGYKLAVATSSPRESTEGHIKNAGFENYFDTMVCGDEIKNSKPNPEIFLIAAKKLGVAPENCFVVEDSYNGVESGNAAGMRVFMIPDLNPPRQKEKDLAYKICKDLSEIIDCIK